ncbi:MAG: hypothetical protein LBC64_04135 [Fibromonadaceae bacterium]|jgi:hypothetical protein|nr:hypothetical protein [Fibromonadaceae bacterium]
MREIENKEYLSSFIENSVFPDRKMRKIHEKAYEIANDNRKFEIDNYWKRASYYWLFQASVYAGYFYSVTAENNEYLCKNPEIIVVVTCLGFLTAFAWYLSNKGSKQWQKNWENHVDELENGITGPLYKTVSDNGTWSVSKINELVSMFSFIAWIFLGFKTIHSFWVYNIFVFVTYILILGLIMFVFLWFGKGLGNNKKPKFFKRGEE